MKSQVAFVAFCLSACATNQEAMLKQDSLQTMNSAKPAGQVAGCAAQRLNAGPAMGTDGTNFWVTRSSAWGVVVRYDFKPEPAGHGSIVHLILETKGYDPLDEVQEAAAQRWVKAVNEGSFGRWRFRMARNPNDVGQLLATSGLEAWY